MECLNFKILELEKLSVVARKTSNAIIVIDKKGKFTWVNKAYSKLFGYKLNEVTGDNSKSIISDKVNENINVLVNNSLTTGRVASYEFETKAKNGENIWLESTITPIVDENGKVSKMVVVDSDISKIKEAEKEIRIQNEHISI